MASFRKLLEDVCRDDKGTVIEYFEDFIKVTIAINIKYKYYPKSDEVGFADALDSEEAVRYSVYFRDTEKENHFDINQLAELLTPEKAHLNFMNMLFPELSSGDWSIVFGYLEEIENQENSYIYSLFKILALFYTELEIRKEGANDYPAKGNKISKTDLFDEIYNVYQQSGFYKQYSKILFFDKEIFCWLWFHIFGKKIEATPFGHSEKVVTPIQEFLNMNYSKESIMEIYCAIIIFNNMPKTKEIINPYHYVRSIIEGSKFAAKSPVEEFYASESEFNDSVKSWKNTKRLGFFRHLLYQTAHGNIAMEIETVFPLVKEMWVHNNKRILIIEPSPDFVNAIKQAKLSTYVKYAFSSKSMACILQFDDKEAVCYYYKMTDKGELSIFKCVEGYRTKQYNDLRKVELHEKQKFQNIIFFARSENKKIYMNLMEKLGEIADLSSISMVQFTPNQWIELHQKRLMQLFNITNIELLPTDTFTENPKKNAITKMNSLDSVTKTIAMKNWFYYADAENPIEHEKNTKKQKDKSRKISGILLKEPWEIQVDREEFLSYDFERSHTLHTLFEKYRPKIQENQNKRVTNKYVEFTPEIRLWYSWSNGRGRYAYYAIPDNTQFRTGLQRGACLFGPKEYKSKEEDKEKLAEKVLNEDLARIIVQDIRKNYADKSITLKTYWLCVRQNLLESKDGKYNDKRMQQILSNQYIANLRSDDENIDVEKILKSLEALYDKESKMIRTALTQLNILFQRANNEAMFTQQPVSGYLREKEKVDKGIRQARKSLTKKSYIADEERRLVQYMKEHMTKDRIFVGALISFYTGLSNREVAALTWEDYNNMAGIHQYQFRVHSVMTDEGNVGLIPPRNKDKYRRVPIVEELNQLLTEHLKYKRRLLQEKESEENKRPIVFKLNENGEIIPCTPADIKQVKDEAEKSLGLKPLEGRTKMGDDQDRTDFNDYKADRFRSNLEFRMLQTCMMSRAEANYVLGLAQNNTFAKHYCDYTNDFAQIAMKSKMERWSFATVESQGANFTIKDIRTNKKIISKQIPNMEIEVNGVVNANINSSEAIDIDILSNRSVDVKLCRKLPVYFK